MKLVGASQQQRRDFMYDASGTTTASTAGLVLARSQARSYLYIANNSNGPLWFEFDGPRGTAVMAGSGFTQTVASVTVTNAGFGFTVPPTIQFLGGGPGGGGGQFINTAYLGLGQPDGDSPSSPAKAHAVLTAGAISSIVIDSPGAGYVTAPYVHIHSHRLDPYGCAIPSAGVGIMIPAGGFKEWNGSCCPTEAVSVFGTGTQAYVVKWMT